MASAWRSASKRDDHLLRVHSRLDDLQRHSAFDRFALFGHIDDPMPPSPNFLQQLVGTNLRARPFR